MRVTCTNANSSAVLEEGREYYAFPAGPQAFYISKFDNAKSHRGAFQRDRFEELEEEPATYRKAVVDTTDPWWRNGKEYIISDAEKTPGNVNVHRLTDGAIIATIQPDRFRIIGPGELPEPPKIKKKKVDPQPEKQAEPEDPVNEQLTLF